MRQPFVELIDHIENCGFSYAIERLPVGAFKASGTNIRTLILSVSS